jgi:pepF/M3 family oligoendopeptidase
MPTATPVQQAPRWNLDTLFAGGSKSTAYRSHLDALEADLRRAETEAKTLPRSLGRAGQGAWIAWILLMQDLARRLDSADSFAGCLTAADVHDDLAHGHTARVDLLAARWLGLQTHLESFAAGVSDTEWRQLLESTELRAIAFALDEMRRLGREKMPPDQERLASELAVNGYHAWNRLYDKMAGDLQVDFEEGGSTRKISLGQLAMYMSNSQRDIRREAFTRLEAAWEPQANLAAMALNAQAGFRLSLYRNRGWANVLKEPLDKGRLRQATLEAMWSAVAAAVPKLVPYVEAKKRLLSIDRFCWYDQTAPVGAGDRTFAFDEAGEFIVAQLADFSSDMAEFSRKALDQRWVEAENRPGKAAGGFCTGFPTHGETRIFMTWGGEYDHLMTLAHELGHAYHGWVLRGAPFFAQRYPMNLAETASTFNELRVTDAALARTSDPREQLMLLDQKLQNALVFFCNLRARFLFDRAFYAERAAGMVPRRRLDELMVDAQRTAFGGLLAEPEGLHPLFWASKLHFYLTGNPFYNFPYTFGFLFANGVYDRARQEGAAFAESYRKLLADTGSMSTEEVARKHLGVDLTQPDFWEAATARILGDVKPFADLAGR